MKLSIFSLLLAFGLFFSSQMKADTLFDKGQKIYIDPGQINITDKGIIVNLTQGIFRSENLGTDKQGIFVYSNELLKAKGRYYCEFCPYIAYTYGELTKHQKRMHSKYDR